ncbi:hypothetical protein BC939DRAFT_298053 [Gamsiella multidivaricata]|uniref:uncharacterized protein n=1 Tax=Gamsiella multidivaricata TaxID=101098 RepID=UPI00221EB06A|nr:uncharacterized protein BC939DRAFT_298053 [Gamsiella multidivaricata]KAI7818208.1 hypothetical protein BC939DRAFT_298053 [Gamsiella multidivaricata]
MPDTLARRHLGPDSGDDFASASEGEEYENMEVSRPVAARPSSAASRGPLTANKYDNGSLSLQQPTGMARTHIPVPLPDQHDDLSPRFGNKSFLSSRPVTDKGQASRAPSYPLHESHAEAPDHGRFQDTNTFSESAASGPNTTVDAKESGRAWGSLSSWINTAVSTVSEVIENPNVVVTKAHNIGQGIRNVATEQIDRVYESLDPEYEYERERLSKQRVQQQSQQSQQAKQHQQQSSADLPWPQFRPPLPPQQTPSSLDKGDLSDLLESSRLQSELRPPSPKLDSSSQLQSLNSTSRLGVPAGNLVDRDGWADDAWGDDWDNEVDLTELTMDTTKKVQPTVESAQSSLAVPLSHEDESRSDKPSSRRSSADLGPAEALFSTLDFASNALGSAVLGVHRKVTQSSQSATLKRGTIDDATHPRTVSPTWINTQRPSSTEGRTRQEATERSDKPTITNPSLEVVGGNVVSTGLGALEILGKKAVDVISDVRRAGHLNHAQGGSISSMDHLEDTGPFKVPSRMNLATLFDDAGGRAHLIAMRSLASTAASRVAPWMSTRQDLLEMGQLYELEQQLQPPSLDSAVKDLPTDLLAGHKDFRAMVTLLEKMGFQGTAHLRQLRNCTRRLTSLVPDSVNAFEQEWHNHQSRASERDFFAKAPIKKFFESRLMLIYFDGLRALSQFTNKTCDQALKLAENIDIHLAEKTGSIGRPNASLDTHEHERPSPSKIAPLLRQFLGNLIAIYCQNLQRDYGGGS